MYIFIAAPYERPDPCFNVRKAVLIAEELIKKGHVPFIPHLCHLWHLVSPHERKYYLDYDFKWLKNCDALFRVPGESQGADQEVIEAREWGMTVYERMEDVPNWK